ncbi:MAG: electron transfer flavoprotein subunit alpha/FixB family protein [Halorubrum sp.]|uniref:electron transfer flavoprotein subunit alpha/FixB family protein n=1 Tax=Halorubrum sp. TaxID=1879286 RepID=UPI003970CF1F
MADVLVVAEHRRGDLRDVSYEAITAGRELADARGGDLHVAVVGGDVDAFAEEMNREGVDAIHTVGNGEEFDHNVYQTAIAALLDRTDAATVVAPNSVNGLDYAPAVAEDRGLPLVTDVIGVEYDGGLTITREMYGSKVETTVDVDGDRHVLTVRGGEWEPAGGVGDAAIESVDVELPASGARVTGFEEVAGGDVDIADADVLVSVGRGIEEEENLELVEELADALGATLSASRPIVDNGWLPKNRQVGQSGKVVTPDVYVAVGISGAVQHVAGMKGSDTIIAINTDPNAPIFDIADYGIVGDLFEVIPELVDEFA